MKKTAVYIGRFAPIHNAHEATIRTALSENDNIIILVGSTNNPRTIKNPFTFKEIEVMIRSSFNEVQNSNIFILPLIDYLYDDTKWITQVQSKISSVVNEEDVITIYGNEKDHSSFYLKFFPQYNFRDIELIDDIHATDIRNLMFKSDNIDGNIMMIQSKVSSSVFTFIKTFIETKIFVSLRDEYNFIVNYKKSWEVAPYAPTFVTTDAIVECNGHVLMIKRKHTPGKGLWAIPGGFINEFEKIEDAVIRELKEETKIDVSKNMLRGSIKNKEVFDNPYRSLRGRTITHAFHLVLNQDNLPKVKADDDAEEAIWFPISALMEMNTQVFEDHLSIISFFTKTDITIKV